MSSIGPMNRGDLLPEISPAKWPVAEGARVGIGRTLRRSLQLDRPLLCSRVAIDLLRAADCLAVVLVGWLALGVTGLEQGLDGYWSSTRLSYCLVTLLGAVMLVNVLQFMGAYSPERVRRSPAHLQDVVVAVAVTAAVLTAAGFFTGTSATFGRLWALAWIVGSLAQLVATRLALHLILKQVRPTSRSGWLRRNVAIVGRAADAERLIAHLQRANDPHVRIVGVYDDRLDQWSEADFARVPAEGPVAELCEASRRLRIDKVFVAMPWSSEADLFQVLRQLECLPVDIRLQLPPIGERLLTRRVSYVHGMPFVNVADRPLGEWGHLLKWSEDRLVALGALIAFAPLMVLVAILIKLESPGPILFRQKRYGFNNGLIEVYKFRTMRQEVCDPTASILTRRDDPRVTRIGRFLRRTSIDELPQLFNVLRGDMSVVGPRPHPLEAKAANRLYQDVVAGYAARHKIKPGITGWAQVNGWRGPTETEEQLRRRVEHDLQYLESWSLTFDLKILFMTVYRGFVSKNAF